MKNTNQSHLEELQLEHQKLCNLNLAAQSTEMGIRNQCNKIEQARRNVEVITKVMMASNVLPNLMEEILKINLEILKETSKL